MIVITKQFWEISGNNEYKWKNAFETYVVCTLRMNGYHILKFQEFIHTADNAKFQRCLFKFFILERTTVVSLVTKTIANWGVEGSIILLDYGA